MAAPSDNDTNINPSNRQVLSVTNYTLNIDRQLKKKLKRCTDIIVEYEYTNGGIRGRLDTASFEVLNMACLELYMNFPADEGFCIFTSTEDKQGDTIVQHTFKVRRNTDPGYTVGYTLNLYLTNNTMLLNWKDIDKFMDVHLPLLHEIMCVSVKPYRDLPTFNRLLTQQLQVIMDQRNTAVVQPAVLHSPNLRSNSNVQLELQDYVHLKEVKGATNVNIPQNSDSPPRNQPDQSNKSLNESPCPDYSHSNAEANPPDITCLKCKRPCKTRSVVCQLGGHWIH